MNVRKMPLQAKIGHNSRLIISDTDLAEIEWIVGGVPAPYSVVLYPRIVIHDASPGIGMLIEGFEATIDDGMSRRASGWGNTPLRAFKGAERQFGPVPRSRPRLAA